MNGCEEVVRWADVSVHIGRHVMDPISLNLWPSICRYIGMCIVRRGGIDRYDNER